MAKSNPIIVVWCTLGIPEVFLLRNVCFPDRVTFQSCDRQFLGSPSTKLLAAHQLDTLRKHLDYGEDVTKITSRKVIDEGINVEIIVCGDLTPFDPSAKARNLGDELDDMYFGKIPKPPEAVVCKCTIGKPVSRCEYPSQDITVFDPTDNHQTFFTLSGEDLPPGSAIITIQSTEGETI